mmetsp:Transcript_59773/g.155227  ORF Transcript_59773/g.155227 Transcript_59773/m.155227 type:complete len:463 (+) Transcript_59773:714-2102(+)
MAHVVCHVVDAAVAEMTEHIAAVEACHGHLADDHLLESGERAENTLAPRVREAEASTGEEVASLHHPALHVDLWALLADTLQPARALQVAVHHQHTAPALLRGAQLGQHAADRGAKLPTRRAERASAQVLAVRVGALRHLLQLLGRLGEPARLEVRERVRLGARIVALAAALNARHARAHLALDHHGGRPRGEKSATHRRVQRVDVFAVDVLAGHALPGERLAQVEALEVLRGVPRDRHVVVVDEELHRQAVGDGEARCLSVVALHLRAIRAEAAHDLPRLRPADAVEVPPQVPEAARTELDARRAPELRVAGEVAVPLPVLHQRLRRHVATEHREHVLSGDAVSSLVEHRGHEHVRPRTEERVEQARLGSRVERAAGMAAVSRGAPARGEEDHGVAEELHVRPQRLLQARRKPLRGPRIDGQQHELVQVDRECAKLEPRPLRRHFRLADVRPEAHVREPAL